MYRSHRVVCFKWANCEACEHLTEATRKSTSVQPISRSLHRTALRVEPPGPAAPGRARITERGALRVLYHQADIIHSKGPSQRASHQPGLDRQRAEASGARNRGQAGPPADRLHTAHGTPGKTLRQHLRVFPSFLSSPLYTGSVVFLRERRKPDERNNSTVSSSKKKYLKKTVSALITFVRPETSSELNTAKQHVITKLQNES